MDKLFLFLSLLGLSSCRTCYEVAWCVEKYPMEWSDTVVYQGEKVYLEVQDTMYVEKLDFVYYKKEKR